jgi:glucosamine--fructose-6-phosphate aminotransferase (isomerizing)
LPPASRNPTKDCVLSAPLPPGRARPGVEALVEELAGRSPDREAELVIIGEDPALVERDAAGFWRSIFCPEDLSPILYALPAQILAHDLALPEGLDPDAPRGLSKVTETW